MTVLLDAGPADKSTEVLDVESDGIGVLAVHDGYAHGYSLVTSRCSRLFRCALMQQYIHVYIHIYMYIYIYVYRHLYMNTNIHTHVHNINMYIYVYIYV